jgi:hypothetical protein
VSIKARLRKLEEALTSRRKRQLGVVILGDDGRTVLRLHYDDGTEESPEGMTLADLPPGPPVLALGGVDDDACLGRKPGEGAPPSLVRRWEGTSREP